MSRNIQPHRRSAGPPKAHRRSQVRSHPLKSQPIKDRSVIRNIRFALLAAAAGVSLAACEPIDTSMLEDVETAAGSLRASAEALNSQTETLQNAAQDPLGALRTAALGATFTKTATAEPNLFVLTDLQTGCQWLATYGADGQAVSLEPRTEAGGAQRCLSPSTRAQAEEPAEG